MLWLNTGLFPPHLCCILSGVDSYSMLAVNVNVNEYELELANDDRKICSSFVIKLVTIFCHYRYLESFEIELEKLNVL